MKEPQKLNPKKRNFMKLVKLVMTTLMVASMAISFAEEAEKATTQECAKDKQEAVAKEPKRVAPKDSGARQQRPRDEDRRQNLRQFNRPDDVGPQSMMLRMFEDPEICEQLELDPAVRKEIAAAFQIIDEKVDAKRDALGAFQANQAKLLVANASEADIMEAVDKVWSTRAEIAKMQISKLLILRSKLTEEQIKKIDQVRSERFRTRRMEQVPEVRERSDKAPKEGIGVKLRGGS